MKPPTLFVTLLVATVVVVFGAQNTQAVTFHFLLFKVPSVPLVLPLFGAVLLGALLGWAVSVPGRFRSMRQRRGLQHQIAEQEQAVAATHNVPQQASDTPPVLP